MRKNRKCATRRTFLCELAAVGSACLIDFPILIAQPKASTLRSRVITARDGSIRKTGSIDKEKVQKLLFASLQKLTGKSLAADAWKALFHKNERVGLKVNCLAGRGMSTHISLVEAIVAGLKLAGIPEEKIIVWDRTDVDLSKAGFKISRSGSGYRCFGTNDRYDEQLGIVSSGSIGSLFSPLLTRFCDSIINVPILKDHDLAGLSASMKNFYGAIHNPNKYHDNACSPYIADVMAVPMIQDKLKLNICDALSVQYHGGPSFKPKWKWDYNGLLVSRDPVAIDAYAYRIIDRKRNLSGLKTLKDSKREPLYIPQASERKLGRSKLEEIEVISL
jgi:uncharacterized protein (DUF362 family)